MRGDNKKIPAGFERRHFIRHPMCFPLKYKLVRKWPSRSSEGEAGKEETSTTINVSRGGLLFSAKKSVKLDSLIMIRLPFQQKVFKIKAKVVHCTKDKETRMYSIGVCFLRFSDAFKVKLIEQIYLISEYRDLRSIQLGRELTLQEASREWISRYSERFRRLYW